ncbi:MAG: hypothetical protein II842_19280 [Butyrivibrio sp.]|nr:hypothetical protein [Butyrivibrio sp.]
MKKILVAIASVVSAVAICAGVYTNNVNASSNEIRVERVANYNGPLNSKIKFENNYAVICEPVISGSVEVGVKEIVYSKSGDKATVVLYDKAGTHDCDKETHYVTYWNIYVPINDNIHAVDVQWN